MDKPPKPGDRIWPKDKKFSKNFDDVYLSECCGATRADPDQDFCSQCHDHAAFANEAGEYEDE